MKKIALHGLKIEEDSKKYLDQILDRLSNEGADVYYTAKFQERNEGLLDTRRIVNGVDSSFDAVFSLGGDALFWSRYLQ